MFDMKNLTRLKRLDENAPETMKAFWAFDKETFKKRCHRCPAQAVDSGRHRADDAVSLLH